MTPAELARQLIEDGAVLAVTPDGLGGDRLELLVGGAQWLTRPARLRWCAVFPEHQGHVHETAYDRLIAHHGRDVALMKDGVMVGYLCPPEESDLVVEEVQDRWADWQARLAIEGNQAELEEFLTEAI